MIVSEARREANRRNALRSTGPRTEAGKDRSRRNALTHGLSAVVVDLPGEEPGQAPAPAAPGPDWPAWLVAEVGVVAARLRRCERLALGHRDRVALRAEVCWDDDRRLEAERLGSGLADDPAGVARALMMTPQGCDWMIERWSLLARALDRAGGWTAGQAALASDLLGRPPEFRPAGPGPGPEPEPAALAELARREVAALLRRKAEAAALDGFDRARARDGSAPDDADPDLRRLRRHEADLHRWLRWCVTQIAEVAAPPAFPAPSPTPAPIPPPEPEPGPTPAPLDDAGPAVPSEFAALLLGYDPASVPEFADSPVGVAGGPGARADAAGPADPASRRPDPRAVLEKARRADRLEKRDRRLG